MTFKLALKYLNGRKTRTILTTLSIVFGVMIIFGLNGLIPALSSAFDQSLNESVHQVDILLTHELGIVFDNKELDKLRDQVDIKVVSPVLERTLSLGETHKIQTLEGDFVNKLIINGWDPETSKEALPLNLDSGRWITSQDKNVLLARVSFLEKVGLGIGDSLTLPSSNGTVEYEIIGMLPKAPALGKEEVYMPLSEAQKIFNLEGKVSAAIAQFDESVINEDQRRKEIKSLFDEGYAFGAIDAGGNEWTAIIEMGNMIFTTFGVIALSMGGFIMYNTFKVSIAERTKDIGTLRTIGARKSDIMKIILFEGLIQGIIGTLIGIVSGYLLLLFIIPIIQPLWRSLFNVELGNPEFSPIIIILSILLGIGIPVLSIIIPAKKAMQVDPLEALRPMTPETHLSAGKTKLYIGRILVIVSGIAMFISQPYVKLLGAISLFAGLIVLCPFLIKPVIHLFSKLSGQSQNHIFKIAKENTERNSIRSANTAITMLVSIALIIAITGMASTFTYGLLGYMEKSMSSDYLVIQDAMILGSDGSVGAGDDLLQKILNIDGVNELTALRQSDAKSGSLPLSMIGIDVESYRSVSGLTFIEGVEEDAYEALKQGKNIIINGALATQSGLKVGDVLPLTTLNGSVEYVIAGIGLDYLNSKSATAYISHENIEQDYNAVNNALFMVNREVGADAKSVEMELINIMENYPTFTVLSYEIWQEFQVEGNATRNKFMYFLTALLAIPSLIALMNTLSMSVIERTREIGMLRAVGMTIKKLKKMILIESLMISFLGVVLGIASGIMLGYAFVELMNISGFVLEYYFPYNGIVISVIVGLVFGTLAALSPINRASKLDIVEAIKYE